jgi:integrase
VWAFEGRTEGTHLSEKEVTRRLVDRQSHKASLRKRKNTTELDLLGGHRTPHDLRRTAATIMGELGIAPDVIDRCLNHREAKKAMRTYQRQKMLPQRKAAFEARGAHLIKTLGHLRSCRRSLPARRQVRADSLEFGA